MPSSRLTLAILEQAPPETLALLLLPLIPAREPVRRDLFIGKVLLDVAPPAAGVVSRSSAGAIQAHPAGARGLVEAWQRLVLDGLIVNWPPKDPHFDTAGIGEMFIRTRLGERVVSAGGDGARFLAARRRLGIELHPALAERLRDTVAAGAFEQAALLSLRAIETRVRALTGDPRSRSGDRLTGVKLMRAAFAPDAGVLADPQAEPGERVGTMELFAGAFGAVRNSLVHTEVEWADSVEAAEYVLLADLLMRLLDRAEQRLLTSSSRGR